MNAIPLAVAFNNFMSDRSGVPVDLVVIHTMVGTVDSATARFGNPTAEVSAHYGVGLDGSLYQWVQESDTAYHAGEWDVNLRSIGIEHEDGGDYNGVRPEVLYTTSAELVRDICTRHSIPIDRAHIVGHREVHATACPDALDIDRIVQEAAGGTDMADETTIREWAKAEARVVLEKEYGPRLEAELQQRFAEVVKKVEDELAALPAGAGTSDDHIKGVVLQTVRAVFDSVAGNMPQP